MKESGLLRFFSFGFLLVALVLLVVGAQRRHTVLPDETIKPPPPPVSEPSFGKSFAPPPEPKPDPEPPAARGPISDLALIENATFTGVTRKDGQLFFTYIPTQKRGKQSCPT
jgi:hypothetical protein